MPRQKTIATLLGPADPARTVPVRPPRYTAEELIQHAEARPEAGFSQPVPPRLRAPVVARRLSLATGAIAAVAVAAALVAGLLTPGTPEGPAPGPAPLGTVVVPIAYELTTDPPPAADRLRELAATITEAPYERESGRYAYHRDRYWGNAVQTSPEGHIMSYVEEMERWTEAGGTTVQRHTILGAEFPNDESRQYWQGVLDEDPLPADGSLILLPDLSAGMPSDRAGLAEWLRGFEGPAMVKPLGMAFEFHLLTRPVRAEILEILADTPGYVWRGEVTDRSGRAGVAVSYDDTAHGQRQVLVFDPQTGVLLAQELVSLSGDPEVAFYGLLEYGWADDRPEVDGPDPAAPSPGG